MLSATGAPWKVDSSALHWTLTVLDEENEIEEFVARIPGFFKSPTVPDATSAILHLMNVPSDCSDPILGSRIHDLLKTCKPGASPLLEDARRNQLHVYLKSLWYCGRGYNQPGYPAPLPSYVCEVFTIPEMILQVRAEEDVSIRVIWHCFGSLLAKCYDPPQFSSSSSDPLLVTLSKPKQPLPLNPPSLPDLPPLPPSEPSKPSSPLDQPPVEPLIPIPWNIHHREYSSMEEYQEPTPVENPLEDPDSPMENAPPLEPQPVTHYEPDVPEGQTYTLSPGEPPIEPWEAYLTQPSSPISRKHSLSPTSPSSAPIRQRTSREGSYQSITPSASSPIAGTSPQSQGYQSTSPGGSADNPSSTQSSADNADSDMALNWVTINTDYLKG